jgi:Tfp pilus assembly protein PilV
MTYSRIRRRGSSAGPAATAGFTLVEFVLASLVILIGISGSFVVINRGVHLMDAARRTTLAGQVLQSAMEDIRMNNWAQLTALQADESNGRTGNVVLDQRFSSYSAVARQTLTSFVCTQTISDLPGSGSPATLKRILITLSFRGTDGREHRLSYTSFYWKQGISDYLYNAH